MRHDLLCLGDAPWSAAPARIRHLLSRAARDRFVFYWEDPVPGAGEPRVELSPAADGVMIATPQLPAALSPELAVATQRALLDDLISTQRLGRPVLWYLAPRPLGFARHVRARAVVYHCHDVAPDGDPARATAEAHLLDRADLVLAASHGLHDHLRGRAANLRCAPPAADVAPFVRARGGALPPDLARIPRPRIGFAGAVDARVDLALVAALAARRPDLQLVMLGAIVGDPARLPAARNVWWLGARDDEARPAYLAGLDAAFLPYRRGPETRFHAPVEPLEAIAAGLPVVATPLRDLVCPYAEAGVVRIAACAETMSTALDEMLAEDPVARGGHADAFIAERTWDAAWARTWGHVEAVIRSRPSGLHAVMGGAGAAAGSSVRACVVRRRSER
jgi:glycosyltransferase involved in cell wall biosynthesis